MSTCDHCSRAGIPYRYHGRNFDGLHANRGERLCPACLDVALQVEADTPVGWAQIPAREYITPIAPGRYR